jgi:hypothetical protein
MHFKDNYFCLSSGKAKKYHVDPVDPVKILDSPVKPGNDGWMMDSPVKPGNDGRQLQGGDESRPG